MVVGSFFFLALPLIISFRPPGEAAFLFTMPVIRDIITNAFILLFFYLNYYVFIPELFFNKNYWVYGICIVFGFLCICVIPSLITGHIPWQIFHNPPFHPPVSGVGNHEPVDHGAMAPGPPDHGATTPGPADHGSMTPGPPDRGPMDSVPADHGPMTPGPAGQGPMDTGRLDQGPALPAPGAEKLSVTQSYSFLQEISHSIYLYITVILFSNLLRTRGRLFQLQKEKINAELSSLKSQINPHFLFNTLNSIYALAVKKDDKTADAVINLAGLMRYMIKEAHGDRIALQKELDYLTNYVELQKARLRETASVSLSINGSAGVLEIAPLILITFVENAFKYGINPEMDSKISIAIDIREYELELRVSNSKVLISSLDLSTGIGLDNTRSRLELLYFKEHRLEITEDKDHYHVFLSIHLI